MLSKDDLDLLDAVRRNNQDHALFLVEQCSSLEFVDSYGNTILMWAVMQNMEQLVKVLLNKGADKSKRNRKGVDVFWIAQEFGRAELLEMLNEFSDNKDSTQ